MKKSACWSFVSAVLVGWTMTGCSGGSCPTTNVSLELCDPDLVTFSLSIDNEFFPLVVGNRYTYEGGNGRLVITVLDETEEIGDVTARVVEEREFENDELIEVSRNFFAQASNGAVCYFGETVENYQNGVVINTNGSWQADEGENAPGIFMPPDPTVGMIFSQEVAPDVAEDLAEIKATDETVEVPAGTFTDTLTVEDCNPLEGGRDDKFYGADTGLLVDEKLELSSTE